MMGASKYSLSYTTGAVLMPEAVIVATLYVELSDWSSVRGRVLEENSFQARTLSTSKKMYGKETLNLLEKQTYIQRNGDYFDYLTDEEQEIKNTDKVKKVQL